MGLGLGLWVLGFGFWGFGFWVLGFGFWVLGFGAGGAPLRGDLSEAGARARHPAS